MSFSGQGGAPYPPSYGAGSGEAVFSTPPVDRELTDAERQALTDAQRDAIEAERRVHAARARQRFLGWIIVSAVALLLLAPALIILGFETGLLVAFFNLAKGLL